MNQTAYPLPLEGDKRQCAASLPAQKTTPSDRLMHANIMMIDDEPLTLEVLQVFLEEVGYRNFTSTQDSRHALTLLAETQPDVVLLDLVMPHVSGFDILTEMRSKPAFEHLPVIVLSSSTDADTKLKALELGANDFLAKPVDPSELVLRLRNTLAAKVYQDSLAYFDALTGLPNRRLFMQRTAAAVTHARNMQTVCAILFVDVDRFNELNDTLGLASGDEVLKQVAKRLERTTRPNDVVGRMHEDEYRMSIARTGGDEFSILLSDLSHYEDAARIAQRILAAMAAPLQISGHELFVTLSIGIALCPDDGDDRDTLLEHADVAMRHAKQRKNTYQFYSKVLNTKSLERLSLVNHLRKALAHEELKLAYQPKVDVKTDQIVGCEGLLRWLHPQLGMIPPQKFIPLAEESGLIIEIGEWVLHQACQQLLKWQANGFDRLRLAINLSTQQFRHNDFSHTLAQTLQSTGVDPQYLTLELTESMIMENAKENIDVLHRMKDMGITLSIDDFGTGYSSLSYLKRFPLDELKIDRSFIIGIPTDDDDSLIATAIIYLAHGLGLQVVAEGVENSEQLKFLSQRGCDEYQGYLFSKPLFEEEFTALLQRRRLT